MQINNVALAVQCAYYWKYKVPLPFHRALEDANEIITGFSFPSFLSQWLSVKGDEHEAHPVVRFLRSLECDRERGR